MRILFLVIASCLFLLNANAQSFNLKQEVGPSEVKMLREIAEQVSESDQRYRKYLSSGTLDDRILEKIDAIYDSLGLEASLQYEQSLNLSLEPQVRDSLWQLQHSLDFQNHLQLRGIFNTYGYLPEAILEDLHYVQMILLMHPPKDWDMRSYLKEYTELLLPEVEEGRMKPKTFALFYDNIKCKILKEPQLYGTNQRYSVKQNKVLPPEIVDINQTNSARVAIGLEPLKEGEYMVSEK